METPEQQAVVLLDEINQYLGSNGGWEHCLKLIATALQQVAREDAEICLQLTNKSHTIYNAADAEKCATAILKAHGLDE